MDDAIFQGELTSFKSIKYIYNLQPLVATPTLQPPSLQLSSNHNLQPLIPIIHPLIPIIHPHALFPGPPPSSPTLLLLLNIPLISQPPKPIFPLDPLPKPTTHQPNGRPIRQNPLIPNPIIHEPTKRDPVPDDLDPAHHRAPDEDRRRDQQNILQHPTKRHHQPGRLANKEDRRDIQRESHTRVQEQDREADPPDVFHGERRDLGDERNEEVHERADGSVVVEGDEGVHLGGAGELVAREEDLDHDEADGFGEDAADLVEETDKDELDLAEAGEGYTEDDDGYVNEDGEVRGSNFEDPGG